MTLKLRILRFWWVWRWHYLVKKYLFPTDALVVWRPTWSKNLGRSLICTYSTLLYGAYVLCKCCNHSHCLHRHSPQLNLSFHHWQNNNPFRQPDHGCPHRILYPIVLILCIFGSYAVNNALLDVFVMIVMGVLGYLMLRMRIPAAPFLIGFILGPLLEDSFRQSLRLSEGGYGIFFDSIICWIFWGLTTGSLLLLLRGRFAISDADIKARAENN